MLITYKFNIYRHHFKRYLWCQAFLNHLYCFKYSHHQLVTLSHPDIIVHVIHFKSVKTFLDPLCFIKINHLHDRLINPPPHLFNPVKFKFENGYFPNLDLDFQYLYLLFLFRLKSRFMRYRIIVFLI